MWPMSALGQKRNQGQLNECPLYPRKRTLELTRGMSALCQKQTLRCGLFDDLIRFGGEIWRDLDAKRLSGLEVDDKLKFARLNHRQVPRFLPLENPPGIDAGLVIALAEVGTIAHQTARQRVFTLLVDRGNSVPRRQSDDFVVLAAEERIASDQHRSGSQLHSCCERGIDFSFVACLQEMYLLTNSMRRFFNVALLLGISLPVRIKKYGD